MKYLLLVLFVFSSSSSFAGFHVDPYLGYVLNGSTKTTSSTFSSSTDLSGLQMGTRVGWSLLGFTFGGEYQFGTVDAEGSAGDEEVDLAFFGVFAGYEFPILVRAWVSYFINAELDGTDTQDGDGIKLGVGYAGFPFLSVNLEYISFEVDGTTSGTRVETEADLTMLSLSFPVSL